MAFKRSAVRSRLSPPKNKGQSKDCPLFFDQGFLFDGTFGLPGTFLTGVMTGITKYQKTNLFQVVSGSIPLIPKNLGQKSLGVTCFGDACYG